MMPGGDERWNEETTGLSAGALENILARVTNDFTPQHQHGQNYQPGFVPSAAPPPWPAAPPPQPPNPNLTPTPVGHNITVVPLATVGSPVSSHSGLGSPVPNTLGIATQVPIQTTNTNTAMGSAARSYSVSQDYFSELGGSRNPLLRSSSDLGIRLNQFQNQGGNYQDGRMEGFMDSSDSLEDFSQTPAYGQESVFFPEVQCGSNVNSSTPPPMQAESTGITNSGGPSPQMQFSFYSNERDKIAANFTAKLSNFTASLGSWFSPFDSFRSNNLANEGQQGASLVPPGCEPTIILEEPLQASHNASPSTIGTGRSTPNCNLNNSSAANFRDAKPTYSSVLSKNTSGQDGKLSSNGANSSSRSSSSSSNSTCITHPPPSSSPGLGGSRSDVPQTRSSTNHNSNNSNKGKNRNSNSSSSTTSNGSTGQVGSGAVNNNGGNSSSRSAGYNKSSNSSTTENNHINSSRVSGLDDFDLTNLTNGRISAYEHYAWEGSADAVPNGSTVGSVGNKSGNTNSPAHQAKKNNSKTEAKKNTPEKTASNKNHENESSRSNTDQLNNKVASGQQKQQPRRTSYINNNLNASNSHSSSNNNEESSRTESSKNKSQRDDKKYSDDSTTTNNNGNTGNSSNSNNNSSHVKNRSGKGANSTGGRSERSDRNLRDNAGKTRSAPRRKKDASLTHTELVVAGWAVVVQWAGIVGQFAAYLFHLTLEVIVMSGRLFFQFLTILGIWAQDRSSQAKTLGQHYWSKFLGYFRKGNKEESKTPGGKGSKERRASYGLECNIALPTTGEEAMKRLLACKGKDPYSILGVTHGCTDEDVKKYYKRQAFLVHPDKNKQPGAEEAFKILAHAFEIIGEPERRAEYDTRLAEEVQLEASWSELASLLTRLQEKLDEAANTIRCTNCNKRHRRTKLSRPIYAARHCAECQINHAAREGDIWAESTMFGLRWRYYACMEGAVYDISEWAACQNENLKHLQANTHSVQYRIVSGKKNPANKNNTPDFPSDPDLEEFFNNLCKEKFGKNYSGGSGGGQPSNGGQGSDMRKRKGKKKK